MPSETFHFILQLASTKSNENEKCMEKWQRIWCYYLLLVVVA